MYLRRNGFHPSSCSLIGHLQGLPSFQILGLPDAAVQESKERVRAAVRNSGFTFPMKRLTVNLAPADIRKAGPAYDLPIAVGLLLASEQLFGQVDRALDDFPIALVAMQAQYGYTLRS
jgi:predicted ATPase with chaperone activity